MTVHRAPQGLLTEGGFFALRLVYTPHYAHSAVATIHTLLELGPACRVYYDGTSYTFHLEIDGVDLESSAVEFAADTEITIDVEHTDERRRIRVRGAAVGDSRIDDTARPAAVVESQIYVLGTHAGGAEEAATLVALRPILADTFEELTDLRLATQNDPDGALRKFTRAIVRRRGRIHDVALAIRDSIDREHAVGDALDLIGAIVGLPRDGFSDTRYRVFLGIQVELLLSQAREDREWTGTAPNLIRITRQFMGPDALTIRYVSYPPKSYTMTVEDLDYDEAFLLATFLRIAQWAEVLGLLQIELGEGDNLWASGSVSVARGGVWGSGSVSVAGEMLWGTAVEVM